MAWLLRTKRSTGWVPVQLAGAGFESGEILIKRDGQHVKLDFNGIYLVPGSGLTNLGLLPTWASLEGRDRYFTANGSSTSIRLSFVAIYLGRNLYWQWRIDNGEVTNERPTRLFGIIEYDTLTAWPSGGV